jgi:[acyl-carrier-protein] S-malonyltransferase
VANNPVFLYPSQGSQHVGMGLDLYETYADARRVFDQADHYLGFPLSRLCFEGPEEELNKDLNAQLAVYTVSCALTDILMSHTILPEAVAGYSSGFYAAAYAAGCCDFMYGLHLVKKAGEILLDEGTKFSGSMAVIFGLSPDKVQSICQQVGNVDIAIMNTPRQIVISGDQSSVKKAMDISLHEEALDVYQLDAATAYHSIFMEGSGTRFLKEIDESCLNDPEVPLISYSSLDFLPSRNNVKTIMAEQLRRPVLWIDVIRKLHDGTNNLFIEVGPGAVLFRTVRWIDRHIEIMVTAKRENVIKVIERQGERS